MRPNERRLYHDEITDLIDARYASNESTSRRAAKKKKLRQKCTQSGVMPLLHVPGASSFEDLGISTSFIGFWRGVGQVLGRVGHFPNGTPNETVLCSHLCLVWTNQLSSTCLWVIWTSTEMTKHSIRFCMTWTRFWNSIGFSALTSTCQLQSGRIEPNPFHGEEEAAEPILTNRGDGHYSYDRLKPQGCSFAI